MSFLLYILKDELSHKPTSNKIQRYVIIGLIFIGIILTLFVYQHVDSPVQNTTQEEPNLVKPEQITPSVQPGNTSKQQTTVKNSLNISLIEQDIHKIANQKRESNGVQPISYDPTLADIARAHSYDMATHQFLSHNSYDGGHDLNYRYSFSGYDCQVQVGSFVYSTSNENIAVVTAQGTELQIAQHIVDMWLGSIADRDNIFDTVHHSEGIGVALTENKMAIYATEDFC